MTENNKISDASGLTLQEVTNVHIDMLRFAVKAEKLNQAFFWAASEMVTPAVNLKTCFKSQTLFLDILLSDKLVKAGDAVRFIHAMEKSYELGMGNMDDALCGRVSNVLFRIRQAYPSPRGMAA